MTYGPTLQWRFPFQERIELRKPDFRVVFISLCVAVVLIVLISFSYYTSFPVSVSSDRFQNNSVDLNRYRKSNNSLSIKVGKSVAGVRKEKLVERTELAEKNEQIELAEAGEIIRFTEKEIDALQQDLNLEIETLNINDNGSESEDADHSNSTLGIRQVLGEAINWSDSRLDILHMPKPQFDTKFQNPCWFEPLRTANPYKNNTYVPFSPAAKRVLAKLTEHWEEAFFAEEKPKRLRCLPYFLIIGQPKCGTTDLFWKIAKHPDIETPPIKELHWWSRSRQGRRFSYTKIIPFDDYIDMFDRAALHIEQRSQNITGNEDSPPADNLKQNNMQMITGEASVSLFWDNREWMKFPENRGLREPSYIVPNYIQHIIPDAKLIVMLRDPIERMYSDYLYFHSENKSADDFHAAVKLAVSLYRKCTARNSVRQCVYDTELANKVRVRLNIGMYSVYLKDWLKLFPLEQFFILRLEDYTKNTVQYIKQIYQFLKIREITKEEENKLLMAPGMNARKPEDQRLGGMYDETRLLLRDFYREYNQELAHILRSTKFLWTDVQN